MVWILESKDTQVSYRGRLECGHDSFHTDHQSKLLKQKISSNPLMYPILCHCPLMIIQ